MNVFILSLLIVIVKGELILDCPANWQSFSTKCYKFVFFPQLKYDAAKAECANHGAHLVAVETENEHLFISDWLLLNDLARRHWYTSGVVVNIDENDLYWESDMRGIPVDRQWWANDEHKVKDGRHIVYFFYATSYRWSRLHGTVAQPYICEIMLRDAGQIVDEERDFDYGLDVADPNRVPRGPVIIKNLKDTVQIKKIGFMSIECVAYAFPPPTYRLYRTSDVDGETEITSDVDPRYTLTNGKLTISNPREELDDGKYYCTVENELGRVKTANVTMSFGFLSDFSNVAREPVRVRMHYFAVISCDPPNYKPAVSYNWLKGKKHNNKLIRTDLNPHIFISHNGNIYFTEVSATDADEYQCIVKLIPGNSMGVGTSQPPSRLSLPIKLEITESYDSVWGPQFGDEFISIFPSRPLRGYRVRLECLAFGTMPIVYKWSRQGSPMPLTSKEEDHNRILTIEDLQLEDSGTYTCTASRGTATRAEKSYHLVVEAKPYFILPLRNQHADIGRELKWRCDAQANPGANYTWYKNGLLFMGIPGAVEIYKNILTINVLNPERDNGMYQVAAHNILGTTFSNAQLRVLAFKPSFFKHPLEVNTMASIGGNTTIICNPEAAPSPSEYRWYKNNVHLGLRPGDTQSRVRLLRNGNLLISPVVQADMATYRCEAINEFGSDSSSGRLTVVQSSVISNGPTHQRTRVNETAFLRCEASHNPTVELVYDWLFENNRINFKNSHFQRGTDLNKGGLYLRNAQFQHSGRYSCVAVTSFDRSVRNATVTVYGPPGEPSGVFVDPAKTTPHSMELWWTPGPDHGSPLMSYRVEVSTNFEPKWQLIAYDIPDRDTIYDGRRFRRYLATGLKPGTGYRFRMIATNMHGIGWPSLPSDVYQTPPAPPNHDPEDVGGGGGSVGDLTIIWKPINESDHGGPGIGYHVYWRRHDPRQNDSLFKKEIVSGNQKKLVLTLGVDTYYLEYDVVVEAFNDIGSGPNSSVVIVYSAEDLPGGTPEQVYAFPFNSTANNVTWKQVPNTRDQMKGKIVGYQINYWNIDDNQTASTSLQSIRYLGQRNNGTVIGLVANHWYEFDVQVYNSAGMGPRSERYRQVVYRSAPRAYPTEVHVWSHGSDSVRVTWRGISTTVHEEPLTGYVIRHWRSHEDIRTANDTSVPKTSSAIVRGITNNTLYTLRVFGYSRGGVGKMSPDRYFSLVGSIRFDQRTTEILAGAPRLDAFETRVLLSLGVLLTAVNYLVNS